MKQFVLAASLSFIAGAALAQTSPQPQQSEVQAKIAVQIGSLVIQNAALQDQVEKLTKELAEAQKPDEKARAIKK